MFLIIIVITAIVAVIYNVLKLNQSKINYPPGWYDVKGFNKAHYFGNAGGNTCICGKVYVSYNKVNLMIPNKETDKRCDDCSKIIQNL